MKKVLFISVFFLGFYAQSQTIKIDPGVYKSRTEGTEILLKLNEDKTFEMTFFHGTYAVEKDTIYFSNKNSSASKFNVLPSKDAEYSSKLKLQFEGKLYAYYAQGIYIGTQKNANTQVEYKPLSDYIDIDQYETLPEKISFEVPKCQFLYLVEQGYEATEVSKFEVGDDLSKAIINYSPNSLANFKLIGYLDSETNKLAITDNKKAVFFSYEKSEDYDNQKELKPLSVVTDNNWAKNNGIDQQDIETGYGYEESNYDFKHVVENSYSDALKTLQKQPSKFLIVSFDLENKERQKQFDAYLKVSQENISSYMYDAYDATYDLYNFYLATDKDKNLLKKYNISSSKEILVMNEYGDLLYHTSGTLEDNSESFWYYAPLNSELSKANQSLSIDKLIGNNKTTIADLTTGFLNALKITPTYNDTYAEAFIEDVQVEDAGEDVVEETVVESAYAEEDYDAIKDKANLYALKSSKENVEEQWEKVIDFNLKNNQYNADFVTIIKAELSNEGFMNRLFNEKKKGLSRLDFKLLDYVFKNHDKIISSEKESYESIDTTSDVYDTYYGYPINIETILEDEVFSYYNTSKDYVQDSRQLENTLIYFKEFLDVFQPNFSSYYQYLNTLEEMSNPEDLNIAYLDTYESMYNEIIKKDANIIESLDANYSKKENNYLSTWESFKSSFSGAGNSAAWHVVKNDKENKYVKKAINWSETSLMIDKNSHYYLDTLAQLYYKDGQKDKAIATQQKAITQAGDNENRTEYETVLEKMKNGTY